MRNRPDTRVAERNFAAVTAQVGVAEAQLYPSIELTGTMGAGTVDRWSFGPSVSLPVLNRGALRSWQRVAESNAHGAELVWRDSVLNDVEEVQVALTLCRHWSQQIQFLERASVSSRTVLNLSREAYVLNGATLTDVLDAERINANNRLTLADAQLNYSLSWIQLQVATGLGWNVVPITTAHETKSPDLTPDPLGRKRYDFRGAYTELTVKLRTNDCSQLVASSTY